MRIVAVAANHKTFINPVLERHREISPDVCVASIAKFRLSLGQKRFGRYRLMNGVALNTRYIVQRVGRRVNVGAIEACGMATQAGIEALCCGEHRERNNRRLTSVCLDVSFTRTMAAFASRVLKLLFAARDAFEVRVFVERKPDIRMASLADCTAHVCSWIGRVGANQHGQ